METGDDRARHEYHLALIIDYLAQQFPLCNVTHGGGNDTETILIESNVPPELYRLMVGRAVLDDRRPGSELLRFLTDGRAVEKLKGAPGGYVTVYYDGKGGVAVEQQTYTPPGGKG